MILISELYISEMILQLCLAVFDKKLVDFIVRVYTVYITDILWKRTKIEIDFLPISVMEFSV